MVVAEVQREVINLFEGGDKEQILSATKTRLDCFSKSMASTAFLQYKNLIVSKISLQEFESLCRDAIYEVLLQHEPTIILDHYHTKYSRQDSTMNALMEQVYDKIVPAHLELPKKFWLISSSGYPPPYAGAISAFQQFSHKKSPMQKVDVLRETAKKICLCVEQFWNVNRKDFPTGEDPAVAADDLVSIFCYVIIKSKVHLLYSESEYIGDYISDGNLMGEIGYLITTFQCCCQVLLNMDAAELLKEPA